jgi:hypothetical protein
MLKFVTHNLENISGVAIYPIISLLIFFFFFVALYSWVYTYRKEKMIEMRNIPFSAEDEIDSTNQ